MKQTDQTKVALYCRTAQSSDMAIQCQMESLKVYAKQQGYTNVEIFIDDGFNGLNLNRPGFQRIVREIEAGNVKIVIASNINRYGRNYCELDRVLGGLHDRYGVRFLTVSGEEIPDSSIPDLLQAIISAYRSTKGGAAK